MLLLNKTIIITGASSGIGKATALLFAKYGAKLILIGRNSTNLNNVKIEADEIGAEKAIIKSLDINNHEKVKDFFNELNKEKIYADCLVNNAGIMESSMFQMFTIEKTRNIYETNVFSTINFTHHAFKAMIKLRKGSIINISSIMGTKGYLGQTVYGSSKSAIIGFTKSLSKELAPLNIRVNCIAPGYIETDMTMSTNKDISEKFLKAIDMRRFGSPMDVAGTILFFASDLSNYITGQVIGVDGGMNI